MVATYARGAYERRAPQPMQKASPGSQGVPQLGHTFAAGAAAGMGSGAGSVTDAGAGATTVSMASASTTGSDATASSGSGMGAASGEATSSAGSGSDAATAAGAGAAARLYPQLMQKTSPALTGAPHWGQAAAPDTGATGAAGACCWTESAAVISAMGLPQPLQNRSVVTT